MFVSVEQCFANAVENHNRVAYRVTHDAKQCCDKQRIDLERRDVAENREDPEKDRNIVDQCHNRRESEAPWVETARDSAEGKGDERHDR